MPAERPLPIRWYPDINSYRSFRFTDPATGISLYPFTATPDQLTRAAAIEMQGDTRRYLYDKEPPASMAMTELGYLENLSRGDLLWEITAPDGRVVGNIGFQGIALGKPPHRNAHVRIVLDANEQKKGYATGAVGMLLDIARMAEFEKIIAEIHQDNEASINVFRRYAQASRRPHKDSPWVELTIFPGKLPARVPPLRIERI